MEVEIITGNVRLTLHFLLPIHPVILSARNGVVPDL